eukprot:scpid50738/ scgid6751/ 
MSKSTVTTHRAKKNAWKRLQSTPGVARYPTSPCCSSDQHFERVEGGGRLERYNYKCFYTILQSLVRHLVHHSRRDVRHEVCAVAHRSESTLLLSSAVTTCPLRNMIVNEGLHGMTRMTNFCAGLANPVVVASLAGEVVDGAQVTHLVCSSKALLR